MTIPFKFESFVADKAFLRVLLFAFFFFKTCNFIKLSHFVNKTNFPVKNHDKITIKDGSFI